MDSETDFFSVLNPVLFEGVKRVLSSSEVRASDLEHGGSWVRIPSRAQIFSVSPYGCFYTSPFISFIILSSKELSKEKTLSRNFYKGLCSGLHVATMF